MSASATFGKRGAGRSVKPVTRQPRTRRSAPSTPVASGTARVNSHNASASEEIMRLERTWRDGALGAFLLFAGYFLFRSADAGAFGMFLGACLMFGGLLTMANHLVGTAKLIVDDEGFRNQGLLISKKMRWEELDSFQITTVNWNKVVNAKAAKLAGSKSNTYVHIPNAALKMKSMQFVQELISRRPDMAEPTFEVMQSVGAGKLLKNI